MKKPGRPAVMVGGLAVLAFAAGTSAVLASGGSRITGPPPVTATGRSVCAAGAATNEDTVTPPDNVVANHVASTLTLQNKCGGGVVVAALTSESTTGAAGYLDGDLYATCLSGCTGTIEASPGHVFLNHQPNDAQSIAGQWVIGSLPKGTWRFDFGVGGDGGSNVDYRTLVVTIYKR